jgi:hypothetical protein
VLRAENELIVQKEVATNKENSLLALHTTLANQEKNAQAGVYIFSENDIPPPFGLYIFSPFRDTLREVKFDSVIPKSPTLM